MVVGVADFKLGTLLMYQKEIHFSNFIYIIKDIYMIYFSEIKIRKTLCRNFVVTYFLKLRIFYFKKIRRCKLYRWIAMPDFLTSIYNGRKIGKNK